MLHPADQQSVNVGNEYQMSLLYWVEWDYLS